MARGDRGLQRVGTTRGGQAFRALERGEAATDRKRVPACAILVEQQDRRTRRVGTRVRARGLDLHQRDKAVDFALARRQPGEYAAETQRLLAQRRAHPVRASARRIALIENEIDDFEHRGEAGDRAIASPLPPHLDSG